MKIPPAPAPRRNRGIALLMLLFIVLAFASTWLVSALSKTNVENQRQKRTVAALAQAKEALIAYVAANPDLSGKKRPGDFPCPAMDEGWSPPVVDSCGNSSGTTGQEKRLGRLPWKKLGLPPLRDGSGELLWYAVSNNFKNNTRIPKLDSTTSGTITVRDSSGHLLYGATPGSGVVAVIIAPGAPITRQDGAVQVRPPDAGVKNYLDVALGEDNADFIDRESSNGFIHGPVRDANNNILLNDQLIAITVEDVMPALKKRVAYEVRVCLNQFKAQKSYLPWAAAPIDNSYVMQEGLYSGNIPDDPGNSWSGCSIQATSGWWLNWKHLVTYQVAEGCTKGAPSGACQPSLPTPSGVGKEFIVTVDHDTISASP